MIECASGEDKRGCGTRVFHADASDPHARLICLCCADHDTHADHVAYVHRTGDASCRSVRVTALPGAIGSAPE